MYAFEEKLEKINKEYGIAGFSVAITDRDRILYSRGFGFDDVTSGIPTTEHSIYRAASITKVVTGTLVMQLVEEGKLSLDTPVLNYLPWFKLSSPYAEKNITLRHLLSHTSGLPGEYTPDGPHDEGQLVASLHEGLPALELKSNPGDGQFLYSNWGVRVVSAVLEAVCGKRYSRLARERVLLPLGMTESSYFGTELPSLVLSISRPHTREEGEKPIPSGEIKENWCRLAAGGLFSSVTDLSRLCRMLLRGGIADNGARIISETSLSEMMREHAIMSSGDGYGLTVQLHHVGDKTVFGHYGSAPPFTSAMYADLERGIGATVMINTPKEGLRREICDMLLTEF